MPISARLGRGSSAMSPEPIVSAVVAKDCRRLRRFFPPRCFRFFAGPEEDEALLLAADVFEAAASAYETAPGFVGAVDAGAPPRLPAGSEAIAAEV